MAKIFVAVAARMAFVEAKDFVYRVLGAKLECNHFSTTRRHDLGVSRVLEFTVPFVAWAFA